MLLTAALHSMMNTPMHQTIPAASAQVMLRTALSGAGLTEELSKTGLMTSPTPVIPSTGLSAAEPETTTECKTSAPGTRPTGLSMENGQTRRIATHPHSIHLTHFGILRNAALNNITARIIQPADMPLSNNSRKTSPMLIPPVTPLPAARFSSRKQTTQYSLLF